MSMLKNNKVPLLYTSLLYLCGFFLFLEWLYPIKDITDTSNLTVFIMYTVLCFFISMLRINWWLSFLIKGLAMIFIVNSLYITYTFLSDLWFQNFYMEMSFNFQALLSQEWYDLTPMFRSILFLVLIWLMSYLLHYWFVVMKRIFLFIFLTIVYLTILDTFTVYDTDNSIIRTFIISFVALGMANFFKEIDYESIRFAWAKKTSVWVLPIISIVLFSTLIGYSAPKYEPQWPDPVPFLTSQSEDTEDSQKGSGPGISRVGYGEDDSRLGGSFVQDYSPVFQAAVKDEHYWRIETKDVYTGKGWKHSTAEYVEQPGGAISLQTFSSTVETEETKTMIDFQGNTNIEKLIYPYGITQVESKETEFLLDENSGEILTKKNNRDTSLDSYSITYNNPKFDMDKMRKVGNEDPAEVNEQFTQLPSSLPERVGVLAEEIAAPFDNRYEKVFAIEQYFGENGFRYETTDIPYPKENQDYVDQFLFESQVGYCDNYSTAMVVMLRTLDIPARWAKGFTSGEKLIEKGEFDIYSVTNANAHSWVEVYFPTIGWVPFEPTQGFTTLADFEYNFDSDSLNGTTDEVPGQNEEQKEKPNNDLSPSESANDQVKMDINWWFVAAGFAVILILAFIAFRTRFRWKTSILYMKLRSKNNAKTYQDAYHHVLKLLKNNGFVKSSDQTLREFAMRIDSRYETKDMIQLTDYYERILYSNEMTKTEVRMLAQKWKKLIKRIMA